MDYRDNRQRWAESHQVVHFYAGQWCTFTPALTPERSRSFAKAAFRTFFGDGRDISLPTTVADVAEPLGVDREALLLALKDPAVKDRLKTETNAAVERGVFGSPFIFVDGEPFWGADRLSDVERWLDSGGW